ncbi:cell division protein SepF [Rarobacter faecitabidus]|uniref:Cell division protein SepF n=1 Tax=Rarobacter faecitabidus TaxID=13243 RepID=A0A542ZWB4_RARFA|nr:cell division protein SepF [Rarobacter faecitabidus]TQL64612.1 cell division inhibitor SepF [Rarobacter faecitabidus]
MASGALRKTMQYLGLGDARDDQEFQEYDDVDGYYEDDAREYDAPVTPIRPVHEAPAQGELSRITTIHPRSYNDARAIGEAFRSGTPVIINLSDMTDADAKRLVDFSAGLIFGLRGSIERVTAKVFLLTPTFVEIAGDQTNREGSRAGFYNQS